ncbi:MAG: NUDIX hydrolase [Actinobacteria bacterium]|jgi:ADP-ribose pyrophosphatase|nr:MAG: NUDIX hydrolase [Actinomycetota bacterium]
MNGEEHETLERKAVFEGKVIRVYLDRVRLPNGREAEREVVLHWGAVGMVALDEEDHVFLVRQFRHATGRDLVEIPAGKLAAGEDTLDCARRELMEEIGYSADRWEGLAVFFTSPGFSNETLHLYLARGLHRGKAAPEEDEFLEIMRVPLAEALSMIARGEIEDSKTICGLALASLLLGGGYTVKD